MVLLGAVAGDQDLRVYLVAGGSHGRIGQGGVGGVVGGVGFARAEVGRHRHRGDGRDPALRPEGLAAEKDCRQWKGQDCKKVRDPGYSHD